jgi:hypothetical protein
MLGLIKKVQCLNRNLAGFDDSRMEFSFMLSSCSSFGQHFDFQLRPFGVIFPKVALAFVTRPKRVIFSHFRE